MNEEISENTLRKLTEKSHTVRTTCIFFLILAGYIWLTVENITHLELLNPENKLSFPIIGATISVLKFYIFAPIFLILFYLYLMVCVSQLAGELAQIRDEFEQKYKYEGTPDKFEKLKTLIPGAMFTSVFLKPNTNDGFTLFCMQLIVFISFFLILPVVLLIIQSGFLPYHDHVINREHRILVIISLILIGFFLWRIYSLKREINQRECKYKIWSWIKKYVVTPFWPIATSIVIFLFLTTSKINGESLKTLLWFFPAYGFGYLGLFWWENKKPESIWKKKFGRYVIWSMTILFSMLAFWISNFILVIPTNNKECWQDLYRRSFPSIADMIPCDEINDLIARNINLPGRILSVPPSDIIIAAYKDENVKLLEHYRTLDLERRDLRFANFQNSIFIKANFKESCLQGTDFRGAKLKGNIFSCAKMYRTNLENARLKGAEFDKSDLSEAVLIGTNKKREDFLDAKIEGAIFLEKERKNNKNMRDFGGDESLFICKPGCP